MASSSSASFDNRPHVVPARRGTSHHRLPSGPRLPTRSRSTAHAAYSASAASLPASQCCPHLTHRQAPPASSAPWDSVADVWHAGHVAGRRPSRSWSSSAAVGYGRGNEGGVLFIRALDGCVVLRVPSCLRLVCAAMHSAGVGRVHSGTAPFGAGAYTRNMQRVSIEPVMAPLWVPAPLVKGITHVEE